ncbi:uncharacterized protein L201_005361 [Kwoniella dendrophila CBS 6074]|uniref:Uncharacterized protein n=1 Tax=Kwoniella dendrophila CBS 6074 TaxID=1295534 RepID=A0AAX4JYX9_9TREE
MASTKSVYVPPHLRNRPSPTPSSSSPSSSRTTDPPSTPPSSSRTYQSAPTRSQSRTPWNASPSSSSHPSKSFFNNVNSPSQNSYGYGNAFTSGNDSRNRSTPSSSINGRDNGNINGYSSSPSLYVYGDSFVGPFKLLREDSVRVQTFKGSSAKGLNNPNSIKQVSKDLLPIINGLLAPPPYAYMPSAGRWVMLIFGNVDLQINYLWQLANKPISHLSFPASSNDPSSDLTEIIDDGDDDDSTEVTANNNQLRSRRSSNVLATATETSSRGPALGPELFVESVVRAYTSWLEREIVNGPVGKRLTELAEQRRSENENASNTASSSSIRRKAPPSKVLIAAALPPLVEDELLPRIPEKYVERLEEDHSKAQKAFERSNHTNNQEDSGNGSKTPWARNGSPRSKNANIGDDELDIGVSTLSLSDTTASISVSPTSSTSTTSSQHSSSTLFDSQRTANLAETMESSIYSSSSISSKSPTNEGSTTSSSPAKTPILELLAHDPPLCTLPIRVKMTNRYNELIKEFCEKYSDILGFIDITSAMKDGNAEDFESIYGEVDRNIWACPVDPTNVHPLWEPTLPLWKEELSSKYNLPVQNWRISEDAEETFKAYEIDKRRRTEKRGDQRDVSSTINDRIKLRDE